MSLKHPIAIVFAVCLMVGSVAVTPASAATPGHVTIQVASR